MRNIIFHIGYHKTGTSWLQKIYFYKHPKINLISNFVKPWDDPFLSYLIRTSERKFEAKRCENFLEKQLETLKDINNDNVVLVSAERLSGHPFSGGYDSFRIAERIKSCVPNAKVICIVRNQIDMINSVYKQLLFEGFTGNIESIINMKTWKSVGFDLSFYEYDIMIKKYRSIFGSSNILILPYEFMQRAIREYLTYLCKFMEINFEDISSNQYKKVVNRSLPGKSLHVIRSLNKFRRSELYPFPLFNMPTFVYKAFFRILQSTENTDMIMSKNIIQSIKKYYKSSNNRLVELVGDEFSFYIDKLNSY